MDHPHILTRDAEFVDMIMQRLQALEVKNDELQKKIDEQDAEFDQLYEPNRRLSFSGDEYQEFTFNMHYPKTNCLLSFSARIELQQDIKSNVLHEYTKNTWETQIPKIFESLQQSSDYVSRIYVLRTEKNIKICFPFCGSTYDLEKFIDHFYGKPFSKLKIHWLNPTSVSSHGFPQLMLDTEAMIERLKKGLHIPWIFKYFIQYPDYDDNDYYDLDNEELLNRI